MSAYFYCESCGETHSSDQHAVFGPSTVLRESTRAAVEARIDGALAVLEAIGNEAECRSCGGPIWFARPRKGKGWFVFDADGSRHECAE